MTRVSLSLLFGHAHSRPLFSFFPAKKEKREEEEADIYFFPLGLYFSSSTNTPHSLPERERRKRKRGYFFFFSFLELCSSWVGFITKCLVLKGARRKPLDLNFWRRGEKTFLFIYRNRSCWEKEKKKTTNKSFLLLGVHLPKGATWLVWRGERFSPCAGRIPWGHVFLSL